jgi:hypothetical protein
MPFVEKNFTYENAMELSKSHLALLVLSHRRSIVLLEERIAKLEEPSEVNEVTESRCKICGQGPKIES